MENLKADYVVVGAGSAGAAIAHRLSETPGTSVILLEAGGVDSHPFIKIPVGMIPTQTLKDTNWFYESAPEPHLNGRKIYVPRGKVLGGSSSINGLFHFRGHPKDFDEWAELGCKGWGYADVLPYFKRSETNWRGENAYHGGKGPVTISPVDTRKLMQTPLRDSVVNAGFKVSNDYNGGEPEGFASVEVTIDKRGRRASTARAYLDPIRNRANLRIITGIHASRILFEGKKAVGLTCHKDGQTLTVSANREIILSAGAYNSPQLLMLSGVGPAADLKALGIPVVHDLAGVGGNLYEHPRMPMQNETKKPITFLNELRMDKAVVSFLRWAVFGNGPFATQISNGHLIARSNPNLDRPDLQTIFSPIRLDAKLWFPGLTGQQQHCIFSNICLIKPKSRGRVSLKSASYTDMPVIQFNIFDNEDDLVALREGVRMIRRVMAAEPFGSILGAEMLPGSAAQSDADLDAVLREMTDITHHPVGTCAMGTGPEAVVDPQSLKVIGIEGLRVADASIMPTIPGANTNAASIMIGEKASDLILGRQLAPEYPQHATRSVA